MRTLSRDKIIAFTEALQRLLWTLILLVNVGIRLIERARYMFNIV